MNQIKAADAWINIRLQLDTQQKNHNNLLAGSLQLKKIEIYVNKSIFILQNLIEIIKLNKKVNFSDFAISEYLKSKQ